MSEPKHNHPHPHGDPNGGSNHPGNRPYWQRAHRSVVFWIAVVLMLAAMMIYVMSDDLGGWHRGETRQPVMAP
jgi:hypothetical protein